LYNYAGQPEKTQDMVNRIMTELYNNNFNGYAGNDDCGEMSVWYVFSALGFYPVNPAGGDYSIGTPLFDRAVIHLPSGNDFTITADRKDKNHKSHKVKQVKLNGKPVKDWKLPHSSLMEGGSLDFTCK
ncbi:MAG: glycoside hydrolase family 92 protein, partial [Muribaculaceae bacterium]|nr:glycoside hydrolase family 92 protein [Muribaculaceae bacterium]